MPDPEFTRFDRNSWEYRAVALSLKTGVFWKWWNEDQRAILTAEYIYGLGGLLTSAQPAEDPEA